MQIFFGGGGGGGGNKVHDGLCKKGEFSSFKNPHFQKEAKCKTVLLLKLVLHENIKTFSYQWLYTQPHSDKEA